MTNEERAPGIWPNIHHEQNFILLYMTVSRKMAHHITSCMVIVFASLLPYVKSKISENIDYLCRDRSRISSQGGRKVMGMEIYFNCIFAYLKTQTIKT